MNFINTTIKKIDMTIGIIVITITLLPQFTFKWLKHEPKDPKWLMFGINNHISSIGKFVYDLCGLWISYDQFIERIKRDGKEWEKIKTKN